LNKISIEGKKLIKRIEWYRGYDLEYEYSVYSYKDCIRWYLEFDEQWIDPPQEVFQTLDDYIENGAPGTFKNGGNSENIKETVLSIKKKYE
jgi:hypothetical protein